MPAWGLGGGRKGEREGGVGKPRREALLRGRSCPRRRGQEAESFEETNAGRLHQQRSFSVIAGTRRSRDKARSRASRARRGHRPAEARSHIFTLETRTHTHEKGTTRPVVRTPGKSARLRDKHECERTEGLKGGPRKPQRVRRPNQARRDPLSPARKGAAAGERAQERERSQVEPRRGVVGGKKSTRGGGERAQRGGRRKQRGGCSRWPPIREEERASSSCPTTAAKRRVAAPAAARFPPTTEEEQRRRRRADGDDERREMERAPEVGAV